MTEPIGEAFITARNCRTQRVKQIPVALWWEGFRFCVTSGTLAAYTIVHKASGLAVPSCFFRSCDDLDRAIELAQELDITPGLEAFDVMRWGGDLETGKSQLETQWPRLYSLIVAAKSKVFGMGGLA